MKATNTLFRLLLAAALSIPAVAYSADPKDFDGGAGPKDGKLDRAELLVMFTQMDPFSFEKIDLNHNGQIEQEELDSGPTDLLHALEKALGSPPPYLVSDVDKYVQKMKGAPTIEAPFGLMIRGKHDVVTVSDPAESFKKAEAATFSYSRDFESHKDIWQATGAVLRPFRLPVKPGGALDAASITPSVSFDRLDNEKDPTKDKNSLIFRLQNEGEFNNLLDNHYLRAFLSYATDFNFEKEIAAVELEWEPVWLNGGIGVFRSIGLDGPIQYRIRPVIHAEYGHVFDAGLSKNLNDNDDFLRVGPRFSLALRPTGFKRLIWTTTISYLGGIVGDPHSAYHLESKLALQIDSAGHFNVNLGYEKGETPLVNDVTNNLTLGLGVKF